MASNFVADNASERRRLHAIADRVSEQDLTRQLENGLTVATVLVHLAFWDDYCTALLKQWERAGFAAARSNFDATNAAIGHLAEAIPPRKALELAVSAADAVDRQVESVSADLAAAVIDGGSERMLLRAVHRRQHLDQIEQLIGSV
jgi:hypothetical protein